MGKLKVSVNKADEQIKDILKANKNTKVETKEKINQKL